MNLCHKKSTSIKVEMLPFPLKTNVPSDGMIYHSTDIYTFDFTSSIVIQVKKLSSVVGGMLNRRGPEVLTLHVFDEKLPVIFNHPLCIFSY